MNRWQDISISDASLKAEFITKFFDGDYIDAFTIISNNPQLNTKAFVANTINQIATILLSLENNFQNGVIDYLAQQYSNFQNIIDNYNLRGNWSASTTYQIYNFVTYNNIDYLYINLTPSSGNLPTNTDYWVEINIQGEKGAPGLGVNLQYDWSATTPYNALDVVYYNNALWVARVDNINKIPGSTEEWETLTGPIVSFYNDGDIEISNLSVDIEPVQDLHGYDAPWPAGGGKNLLNDSQMANASYNKYNIPNTLKPDTQYTFSVFGTSSYRYGLFLSPDNSTTGGGATVRLVGYLMPNDHLSFTTPSDMSGYPFLLIGGNSSVAGLVDTVMFQIEEGNVSNPTFAPYSNECPISGWDSVDIWNKPTHDTTLPPTVTIQLGQTVYGGTLTIDEGGSVKALVDRIKHIVNGTEAQVANQTMNDAVYRTGIRIADFAPNATGDDAVQVLCNIGRGSSRILGGSATVGDCCLFTVGGIACVLIGVPIAYNTTAAAKQWLIDNNCEFVAKLATPIEIQLDPVTISTISGQTNNVWADAGDITVELDKKYWEEFIKFKLASIYTDYIEPSEDSLYNGLIWFEVFNPQNWSYLTNRNYTWNQINTNNDTWESVDRGDY